MSQKDLQFIERALVHPWMFWVYFWKWPRIVRQACAEYDLLAKERDAAKAAHERSERANKIVRDWIHVTHRLSTTPEAIRAIFAAGKRLSILLVFLVVTNVFGQAPPYLRNQWTTNANPLALKVISTNGVHAATNVWELDFTNTATVTVSAVSNANKVMVSLTSASGGFTNDIWIHTNDGVGWRTTFNQWITVTNPTANAQVTNGGFQGASFLSISPGISSGSYARTDAGGFSSGTFDAATNCYVRSFWGAMAAANFERSSNCFLLPAQGGLASAYITDSSDCFLTSTEGSYSGAWMDETKNSSVVSRGGGFAGGAFHRNTNCVINVDIGLGFGYFLANTGTITALQGGIAVGTVGENGRLYANESAMSVGRDVVSTNSWTFGHRFTNSQNFSFGVGFEGVRQFGVASNGLMTIENIEYNWPNAHAVGFLTNNGSGGLGWAASGGSGGSEATTNGIMQPFDVSKTWLVFMGDSIGTTVGTAFVPYSTHATNFPWWQGVAFCTNLSVGGDTFFNQTNNFIVNTLPLLPAVATNGTNVIITIEPGINDFKASVTFANMKTGHVEFANMLHSRGYTVVRTTILPSEPMNDTLYGPLFQFNNWVRTASNYFDRVADFARTLPDNSNLEFYTNDFIHPVSLGSYELAKEWDTSVRFMTKHPSDLIDRLGHTWEARDHDGTFRLSIGSEFFGSNSVNGVFFTGDNASGNQSGIFMTNSGNQDLIYNVANAQAHVFKEGNAEILRFGENGLSTPMLTLTGTGDSLTTTALVFLNAGGTGNDVGIWRDTDNVSIHYKAGQGSFTGPGHTWYLGDTQYLTVRLNGAYANAVFTSVAPTNTFSGKVTITNNFKALAGVAFSRFATNANVTMTPDFYVWAITSVAVLVTNTLPSASTCTGTHFIIKDEGGNASSTNIVIAVQSGDRIDGATTATINVNYGAKNIYSAGSTNFFIY